MTENASPALLEVENLTTRFQTRSGSVHAVDDVSFHVRHGETLAIVGESGCGKTVTMLTLARLLPTAARAFVSGHAAFRGRDLLRLTDREMRGVRGRELSMIFQEPMSSLNPVMRIGAQVAESFRIHDGLTAGEARARAVEMLRAVNLPDAEQIARRYPHQLSGGMRQRVLIAIALACRPALMIADEPTTALDVTVQAQILRLLRGMKEERGISVVLITHDLAVVSEMADRVMVMYAGRKVEEAGLDELLRHPLHPYTVGLIRSVPRLGATLGRAGPERLYEIPGSVPSLGRPDPGCAFEARCSYATARCKVERPSLRAVGAGHQVVCHADLS